LYVVWERMYIERDFNLRNAGFSDSELRKRRERERRLAGGGTQNAGFLIRGTLSTKSVALGNGVVEEVSDAVDCVVEPSGEGQLSTRRTLDR
jgi:hypothetical protein